MKCLITTVETYWLATKYKSIVDFIGTKEDGTEGKFIRLTIVGDQNGFTNTNYSYNGAWASNSFLIEFWNDGTNSSGIISASSSTELTINGNDLVNQLSLNGSISSVEFSSEIPAFGSNKLTNLAIDIIH